MTNSEFIKIGDLINAKPKGADYDLISGKVYDLSYDSFNGITIFKENGELNLPKKIYQTESDTKFKTRVLKYFNESTTNTTGVMLAGTKGTGKSVMAKIIAKESNLPIIIVNPNYPERKLVEFFKSFETPVCVIFDEVEKGFKTDMMLDFLDGIEKTAKKLVLMTCNELGKVSQYMQDRCSRIRYLRKYSPADNIAFLPALIEDFGIKNGEEVIEFCKTKISLLSMDNIVGFLSEVKMLEDENLSLEEIIGIMNIATKNTASSPKQIEEVAVEVNTPTVEDIKEACEEIYDDEEEYFNDDYDDFLTKL